MPLGYSQVPSPPPSPPPTPPPSPSRHRLGIPEHAVGLHGTAETRKASYAQRLQAVNSTLEAMVDAARQRRGSKGVGGLVARETPEERNARRAEARAVKAIRALRAAESRLRTIETDSEIRDGADSGTHGATDATSQLMEQMWTTAAREAARDAIAEVREEIEEAKRRITIKQTDGENIAAGLQHDAVATATAAQQEKIASATREVAEVREAKEDAERRALELQGRLVQLSTSVREQKLQHGEQIAAVEASRSRAVAEMEQAREKLSTVQATEAATEADMRTAQEELDARTQADASFFAEQVVRAEHRAAQTEQRLRHALADKVQLNATVASAARKAREAEQSFEERLREAMRRQAAVEAQLQKAEARAVRAERQAREAARTALAAATAARTLTQSEASLQAASALVGASAKSSVSRPRDKARDAAADMISSRVHKYARGSGFSGNYETVARHEVGCTYRVSAADQPVPDAAIPQTNSGPPGIMIVQPAVKTVTTISNVGDLSPPSGLQSDNVDLSDSPSNASHPTATAESLQESPLSTLGANDESNQSTLSENDYSIQSTPQREPNVDMTSLGGKEYEARRGRKKVTLQVGGMSLQHFERGKPVASYLYMSLDGWGETMDGNLELRMADGKMVSFKTDDAEEICAAMSAAAQVLATKMKSPSPS